MICLVSNSNQVVPIRKTYLVSIVLHAVHPITEELLNVTLRKGFIWVQDPVFKDIY